MQDRCSEYLKGLVLFERHIRWLHTYPTDRVRQGVHRSSLFIEVSLPKPEGRRPEDSIRDCIMNILKGSGYAGSVAA